MVPSTNLSVPLRIVLLCRPTVHRRQRFMLLQPLASDFYFALIISRGLSHHSITITTCIQASALQAFSKVHDDDDCSRDLCEVYLHLWRERNLACRIPKKKKCILVFVYILFESGRFTKVGLYDSIDMNFSSDCNWIVKTYLQSCTGVSGKCFVFTRIQTDVRPPPWWYLIVW